MTMTFGGPIQNEEKKPRPATSAMQNIIKKRLPDCFQLPKSAVKTRPSAIKIRDSSFTISRSGSAQRIYQSPTRNLKHPASAAT